MLSREERISHIDLSSPCTFKESGLSKEESCKFFGLDNDIDNWKEAKIERCHLCECGSTNGWCTNSEHYYIGTHSENMFDIPQDVRIAKGKAGGLASATNKNEKGKSINAQKGAKAANAKSHKVKNAEGKSLKAVKMMEASLFSIATPITLVKVESGEVLCYRSKRETVRETPLSDHDLSKLLSQKQTEIKGYILTH